MVNSILSYDFPRNKPYLILGKGPTFENIYKYDLEQYNVICLNHTAEIINCLIFHFIDTECISGKAIHNSKIICCPIFPHINCKAKDDPAVSYFIKYHKFDLSKLFCYNCSTWKKIPILRYGQIIKAKYFSSEAVFRILGMKGIQTIYSLGIDGGDKYANQFSHLKPLVNNRKTFDDQFRELNKIVKKWNIEWTRL